MDDNRNGTESVWNKLVQKFSVWLLGITIAILGFMYTDMRTRVTTLEDRVSFLYQDKISRAEFREEIGQVRLQLEGTKSDILSRIDFYFRTIQDNNRDGTRR